MTKGLASAAPLRHCRGGQVRIARLARWRLLPVEGVSDGGPRGGRGCGAGTP